MLKKWDNQEKISEMSDEEGCSVIDHVLGSYQLDILR